MGICHVKSAHLETVLDRIEELLQRTVWTDAKDMGKVPDLWKKAKPFMKAERLDRWEAGNIDVVKGACIAAYDMKMTLSVVVTQEVPEQAKKLWDLTITRAEDALGSIGDGCVPMKELEGVIEALVKMYSVSVSLDRVAHVDRGHKTVAKDVAALVLKKSQSSHQCARHSWSTDRVKMKGVSEIMISSEVLAQQIHGFFSTQNRRRKRGTQTQLA